MAIYLKPVWIILWFVLFLGKTSIAIDDCCYLDAPSDLVVIDTENTKITIGWSDNSFGEEGFVIERCSYIYHMEDYSLFKTVALVPENTTFYTDEEIYANTTYLYRVKAFNDVSESGYSNIVAARSNTPSVVVYCFIGASANEMSKGQLQIVLLFSAVGVGLMPWMIEWGFKKLC